MGQVARKQRILPRDVANLAMFLAFHDGRMITGQQRIVGGGRA